jgi:RNA polymerase sigma-70 factor (ECF subfamily)
LQEDAASDVLQDTIISIWKQIESYNPTKGRIFTWMLNICRNKSLDYLRSKHVKYKIHNPEAIVYYEENESTSQKVDQIGLREIVEKLPIDLKHALEIVYFGGYTHEEAAKELGIPLGTLKSRVRLALKHIRELLKHDISES